MNKILPIILVVVFSGYSSNAFSDEYSFDSYDEGYEHGYDDEGSINQRRLETDPAYEDGVMDGEDEADREHVEHGGTLGYPHPDSYGNGGGYSNKRGSYSSGGSKSYEQIKKDNAKFMKKFNSKEERIKREALMKKIRKQYE